MLSNLNKPLVGVILGAVLGVVDGATAWFTPEVRPMIQGILVGSSIKGMLTGVAAGLFARKTRSVGMGVLFGLGVGLLLSYLVAAMPSPDNKHYYFEIMLPGSILGALVGFATQRMGRDSRVAAHG